MSKDDTEDSRGFPASIEDYYSELHSKIVDEMMRCLERLDIPDDVEHRKSICVTLLDMAALWGIRTGVCDTPFFVDMAQASYEEALILSSEGHSRLKKDPLN